MNDPLNPRPGLWARLRRPSPRWSVLALASVGFVAGAISWGGFEASLQATNSTQFCTGCHEMRDTVYAEFRGTIHDRNRTGVRASCGDCHVPRDWLHKLARKVHSTNEIYHALAGTIDTPAKFEAQRLALATRVWDDMKASNSRECRNCHAFEAMDPGRQQEFARMAHQDAPANGQTCIDCHKGIAHALPRE